MQRSAETRRPGIHADASRHTLSTPKTPEEQADPLWFLHTLMTVAPPSGQFVLQHLPADLRHRGQSLMINIYGDFNKITASELPD